jgi:hypothetical protein
MWAGISYGICLGVWRKMLSVFSPIVFFGKDKKKAIKAVVDHLILSTVGKQHIFQSHPSCQRNTFLPL